MRVGGVSPTEEDGPCPCDCRNNLSGKIATITYMYYQEYVKARRRVKLLHIHVHELARPETEASKPVAIAL